MAAEATGLINPSLPAGATTNVYTIEASAYDIVGIAAHNFGVLRDENGHVLSQMHGLATNAKNKILPIGRIGDHLKFYHFGPRAHLFGLEPGGNRNCIKPGQKTIKILSDFQARCWPAGITRSKHYLI